MGRGCVLLVERVLDDARFIGEALAEARETRETTLLDLLCLHLEDAGDAAALLAAEPFDAVLLGIDGAGRQAFDAFVAVRDAAPQIPIVALVNAADRDFGQRLLREGAQDYLVRGRFDYIPLARALENAVERHRVLWAAQSASFFDPLTGLLNERGFAFVEAREGGAASSVCCAVSVAGLSSEARDVVLLECADALRHCLGPDSAIARSGGATFQIVMRSDDPDVVVRAIEATGRFESVSACARMGTHT